MKLLRIILATMAMTLVAGNASALVIDFEAYAQTPGGTPTTQGDVTVDGFLFNSSTDHTHFANNFGGGDSGSTFFGSDDFAGISSLTVSKVGGGSFSLLSMDLGNWFEMSTSLQIIGNLAGGGSVSTVIALGGFSTYDFGWYNLDSLVFDSLAGAGDQYYGMDNMNIAVPEPSVIALFGVGLLGLFISRRRKHLL